MDAISRYARSGLHAPGVHGGYRADIDGLRAVAITAVVLFHAGVPGFGGGFVGVDIFLVISGYLVGGTVAADMAAGRFSLPRFYARRARRIVPALLAVTALCFALGCLLLSPVELWRLAGSQAAALAGLSNGWFMLSAGYFTPDARYEPWLMTWSLGVEEQFYLLLPGLIWLLRRWRQTAVLPGIALLTLASLLLSGWATPRFPPESFYLLPTRAWEPGVGMLLALLPPFQLGRRREPVALAGAAAILVALVGYDEHVAMPGWAALLPVMGSAALIAANGSAVNRRVLEARPAVAVGLVSYSWYLWHWPLLAFARVATAGAPPLWLNGAIAVVSLGIASASWRWVEQPCRRGRRGIKDTRVLAIAAGAVVLCGLPLLLTVAERGWPVRLGERGKAAARIIAEGQGGPCLVSDATDAPPLGPPCVAGARGQPRLALLGDSHANALGASLRARATAAGWGFVQFTKPSCPPLLGGTRLLPTHPGHAARCSAFSQHAIERIARDPLVRTVVVTGFWQVPFDPRAIASGDGYAEAERPGLSSADALADALGHTVDRLRTAGKRVVLLGDAPGLRYDPARRAFTAFLPWRAALARLALGAADTDHASPAQVSADDGEGERIVMAVARAHHVPYASLAATLCDHHGCRTGDNGQPFFVDPNHLSRPGADAALAGVTATLFGPEAGATTIGASSR